MFTTRAHVFPIADYGQAAKCSELPRETPSYDRAWTYYYGGGSDGEVGNSRSLRYEILSRIIEFLQAFSRLAMFLLAGLISEDDSLVYSIAQRTRASPACLDNNTRQRTG